MNRSIENVRVMAECIQVWVKQITLQRWESTYFQITLPGSITVTPLYQYYRNESKKNMYYSILIIYSFVTGRVSLADPRMIFNRNRDIIYLEKNSAASSSCRLCCSEAFLMFRGARIKKNTMLLYVERIGPPSPSANTVQH
jgi:hypothetical protein